MSEALQQLIRQAELQKLQMEMSIRFSKNLALFEERMPKLFELIKDRTPEKWLVRLDKEGQLNLYNKITPQFLYARSPREYCRHQVERFSQHAKPRRYRVIKNKPYNDTHLHIPSLNKLIDDYEGCNDVPRVKTTPDFMSTLAVSGVGIGYHLLDIIDKFDVVNMVIYEGDVDVFLGSMQTVDWRVILDHFRTEGRSIGISVGTTPELAMSQLEYLVGDKGLFTMAYSFILQHTGRKEELEFIDTYEKDLRAHIGGIGYFDDEQIGLAHAYHNLKSDIAVFVNKKQHFRKTPVFIVGNGPSLDRHENYIKENRAHAIVVSCGTSLPSLLRMGIKPDFHVEMERCRFVRDLIKYGATEDQLKGITLLALHSVSPKTMELFDDACYGIKPNDAGRSLVHEYFLPTKLAELFYCNPTVANCGLAFAVSMGFEYIHLIGTDFGVKTSDQHHSKNSIYADMEKHLKTREPEHRFFRTQTAIHRPANFGGEVMVSPVLDIARVSMERFLTLVSPSFPRLKVINSNDGVLIKGAEPSPMDDLPTFDGDKDKEIASIKEDHFLSRRNVSIESQDPKHRLAYFYSVESGLYLKEKVASDKEMQIEFRRIYSLIHKKNDIVTYSLMKGSISMFLTCIAEHSFLCEHEEDRRERYAIGRDHYNTFIKSVYLKMQQDPYALDETRSELIQKMEEGKKSKASS